MEIWLDTCDSKVISSSSHFGFIHGITTNPSILAEADEHHEKVLNQLLEIQEGPVAIQVTAGNAEEIIRRALALNIFSDRIIVKIPVTQQGLIAMHALREKNVPIIATAVYHTNQALLAALAGAAYIAPYLGRMLDAGLDAYATLQSILTIYQKHQFKTKILVAAIKTVEQLMTCAEMGIHAATLKSALFSQFIAENSFTQEALRAFIEDWESRECHSSSTSLML